MYLQLASNVMLDMPVVCQMTKLEQIKTLKIGQILTKKTFDEGHKHYFKQQLRTLYAKSDNLPCSHVLALGILGKKICARRGHLFGCIFAKYASKKNMLVGVKISCKKEAPLPKNVKIPKQLHQK